MQSPKVSILMATYNRAGFIGPAIESVRKQTRKDWELIIADDGSSDATSEVVKSWEKKESRIVYARSEINQGISKNYNRGLRLAKGEYVAMIDDDDPWLDDGKLEKQIKFLDGNPDYVGCGGGVIVVGPSAVIASEAESDSAKRSNLGIASSFETPRNDVKELYRYLKPEKDEEIRKYMLFSNPMANSTTVFRKAAGEKVGWYDESTRYSGDRDFWLKMGLVGKLYNFPEYFSYYTMSDSNTSVQKIRPHLKASLMIMKRYKGKYPGYVSALAFNELQYFYSFLPEKIRKPIHFALARMKRRTLG
ncbi:MAG: glycosyltransferase family 2 protein [Candidatus Liptonbacteria bacterium]|nr:glycosyltransferase family 2 protein [Candidatus Liptonbacteria bacterium]